MKLTKNPDIGKHKYSSYDIGFDSRSDFPFTDGSIGKTVIIFGADTSSFVYIGKKNKDFSILGKELTQLDD